MTESRSRANPARWGTVKPTSLLHIRVSVELIDQLRKAAHVKSKCEDRYISMSDLIRDWLTERVKEEEIN